MSYSATIPIGLYLKIWMAWMESDSYMADILFFTYMENILKGEFSTSTIRFEGIERLVSFTDENEFIEFKLRYFNDTL